MDEQQLRKAGTADLVDEHGVVFGVAHWWPGAEGERWYARAVDNARVMTIGRTVESVTKRLARKIEERTKQQ